MASRKQACFEFDDYSDGYSDDPLDDDYWGEEDGDDADHQEPEVLVVAPLPKKQPVVPVKPGCSRQRQRKPRKSWRR